MLVMMIIPFYQNKVPIAIVKFTSQECSQADAEKLLFNEELHKVAW